MKLDATVSVPVHVQLGEQLKRLISTGYFKEGSRLPSNRELAGYLRINRNTVARVMAQLERDGYAESRRGTGRYVKRPPQDAREPERERLVDRIASYAAAHGLSADELARALLARAVAPISEKTLVAFVECNPWQAERFSAELEEQLPVKVEGLLLSELRERLSKGEDLPWRFVVTTFFHVHEVERFIEGHDLEAIGMLAMATLENLRRLKDLPAGTKVGVLGDIKEGVYNLLRSIEGAGLDHLDLVSAYGEGEEMREILQRVEAVVCSSRVAQTLPELGATPDLKVIVEDRTLDRWGIDMLGQLLAQSARGESGGA